MGTESRRCYSTWNSHYEGTTGQGPSKQNQSQKSKGETASRQRNQGRPEDMLERVTGMAGGWGNCSEFSLTGKMSLAPPPSQMVAANVKEYEAREMPGTVPAAQQSRVRATFLLWSL